VLKDGFERVCPEVLPAEGRPGQVALLELIEATEGPPQLDEVWAENPWRGPVEHNDRLMVRPPRWWAS